MDSETLLELVDYGPLTEEEEAGIAAFDIEACGHFRGHAPTNLAKGSTVTGPVWTLRCRHGCGHMLSYGEYFAWCDANKAEWEGEALVAQKEKVGWADSS